MVKITLPMTANAVYRFFWHRYTPAGHSISSRAGEMHHSTPGVVMRLVATSRAAISTAPATAKGVA